MLLAEAPLASQIISPVKCVKNEIHNILTVIRLTRNKRSKRDNSITKQFQVSHSP